ncbi:MAG: alanine racemase [Negativicutes bacterium]|nr:alanine racemase [Negativicutes bacterium]
MKITDLCTPCFLLDSDVLERNINSMAAVCRKHGVQLWPMVKTHKSSDIAQMQKAAGAAGFLAGTLDEAEVLIKKGLTDIMLAYPVANAACIERVLKLSEAARIIVTLDGLGPAVKLNQRLTEAKRTMEYLIKIDCGLHRLGVSPEKAADLAAQLRPLTQLRLTGIATHPGHVYAAASAAGVKLAAADEAAALRKARDVLHAQGFAVEMVAAGSTPTALHAAQDPAINVLRPGNYVFYDNIQITLGTADEADCALTVLATIISRPQADLFIIDAGSKCFGLDKGAHAASLISSFGLVKGHPELVVTGLSEEIGKITIMGKTSLQVGDKLQIIPNHSCSAANMTGYLIRHRAGNVDRCVAVDMRGGSRKPPLC